jgi:hypothetical protein
MPPCQTTEKIAEMDTNEYGKVAIERCPSCQGLFLRQMSRDKFDGRRWIDPDAILASRLGKAMQAYFDLPKR